MTPLDGETIFTVRHVTRDEAEGMSGGSSAGMRWVIVDADDPESVHHAQSMLGLPSGADYLIGAIKYARTIARRGGRRLVLSPEMAAFEVAVREEPPEGELRSLDDPCSECGAEPGDPCQARPGESQITPHRVAVREEPASACVCGHDLKQHRAEYGTDCAVCGCRAFTKREDTERPDGDSHWATVVIDDAFEPREITDAEAEQLYESGIGIDVERMRIRPGVRDTERPDELVDFPEETLVALKELIYPLEDLPSSDRLLRMVEKAIETKRRAA